MPHFGLMDENNLQPDEAALLRARLHLRSSRRQLRQKKYAAAITTMYDALISALRSYILSSRHSDKFQDSDFSFLENDLALYHLFQQRGIIDNTISNHTFIMISEQALLLSDPPFNCSDILLKIEEIMLQLEVLPFLESTLPPEDPSIF